VSVFMFAEGICKAKTTRFFAVVSFDGFWHLLVSSLSCSCRYNSRLKLEALSSILCVQYTEEDSSARLGLEICAVCCSIVHLAILLYVCSHAFYQTYGL
jgi:hypothetical protein